MEISYALTSLIVSLGVFCGVFLGYIAKEELKPGKKYLALLQNIILAVMLVLVAYFRPKPYIAVLFAFMFFVMLDHSGAIKGPKQACYYFVYAVFALLFFESRGFIPYSSLMFLYGFPTGSLLFMKKKGREKALFIAALFFALSLLLFFATTCPS